MPRRDPGGQGVLTALESPEGNRIALSLRLYVEGSPYGPVLVPGSTTVIAP